MTPEIGTLPVQESMQVTVEYNPQKTGDHNSELVVSYDTGKITEYYRQNVRRHHFILFKGIVCIFTIEVGIFI